MSKVINNFIINKKDIKIKKNEIFNKKENKNNKKNKIQTNRIMKEVDLYILFIRLVGKILNIKILVNIIIQLVY